MSLDSRIREQIDTTGPVSVLEFTTQALYDPLDGYYGKKVPIGRSGDYITAPEMTQVFGEVIALWLIDLWQQAGSPSPFHLVEIGPGRGTMMADILRTIVSLKIPLPNVHLVEVSPLLKEQQRTALSPYSTSVFWHPNLTTLPEDHGFCLMVANEFWDALPIQQFAKTKDDWIERHVGKEGDDLIFLPEEAEAIREVCPAMPSLVSQISQHLKACKGAALFLDYGYDHEGAIGDTLQAVHHHQKQGPLVNVGQADLTHHVDFHRLKSLFEEIDLMVHGPVPQGEFLKSIGLEIRTEQLCERANPNQVSSLQTAAVRLIHPSHMGTLFKVMCVREESTRSPEGFFIP
ncbi:MAG: SAM-dependent methyltransferase [Alphaproteobacteria bacterium]|jgi:NADH dehydrogenase [ubiquinone] 1 alpha subcomplex assembly factor 7|nr:SAM-dependent methyltransferase [Alphaproteobacteria bacterium]